MRSLVAGMSRLFDARAEKRIHDGVERSPAARRPCRADQTYPLGAKGAGEAGTVGALPAIVNAVMDALAPLGVKSLDMAATSERIWLAMRDARP